MKKFVGGGDDGGEIPGGEAQRDLGGDMGTVEKIGADQDKAQADDDDAVGKEIGVGVDESQANGVKRFKIKGEIQAQVGSQNSDTRDLGGDKYHRREDRFVNELEQGFRYHFGRWAAG